MTEKIQQYSRTEYIQPPITPPTLDAKKSPLALLAQTCSAIGKDPTTTSQPTNPQSKPFHATGMLLNSPSKLFRKTSVACASPNSALPRVPTASPALSEGKAEHFRHDMSPPKSMASYIANWRTFSHMAKYGELAKLHTPELDHKKITVAESRKRKSVAQQEVCDRKISKHDHFHASQQPSSSPGANLTSTTYSVSPSEFLKRSSSKTSPVPHPLMSLYDSYSTRCQASHVGGTSCADPLKAASLPFHLLGNPTANVYPMYASMFMAGSRNPVPALDSSQFVCNWVNPGSRTCGKRFSSADELSNHLRTHVIATPSDPGVNYFMNSLEKFAATPYAAAYLSQAAALAAAAPIPNAINCNLLSRSHSPLGGYPYKANMLSQFTSSLPSLPIPAGVGPYSSPYGLYNPKLNPATAGFYP